MTIADQYLIAHKVRGEQAFDVAEKLQIGNEEGWIIPSTGHRAYPYWSTQLSSLIYNEHIQAPPMPEQLQDFYSCNNPTIKPKTRQIASNKTPKPTIDDLL